MWLVAFGVLECLGRHVRLCANQYAACLLSSPGAWHDPESQHLTDDSPFHTVSGNRPATRLRRKLGTYTGPKPPYSSPKCRRSLPSSPEDGHRYRRFRSPGLCVVMLCPVPLCSEAETGDNIDVPAQHGFICARSVGAAQRWCSLPDHGDLPAVPRIAAVAAVCVDRGDVGRGHHAGQGALVCRWRPYRSRNGFGLPVARRFVT